MGRERWGGGGGGGADSALITENLEGFMDFCLGLRVVHLDNGRRGRGKLDRLSWPDYGF